jgi:hypothetical protein
MQISKRKQLHHSLVGDVFMVTYRTCDRCGHKPPPQAEHVVPLPLLRDSADSAVTELND